MKTTTYTTLIWTDPRLAFDQSDYDGIDRFHINSEEVSKKDILKKYYTNKIVGKSPFFLQNCRFGFQI